MLPAGESWTEEGDGESAEVDRARGSAQALLAPTDVRSAFGRELYCWFAAVVVVCQTAARPQLRGAVLSAPVCW